MSNSAAEIWISPTMKKVKLSECENEDRLSDLPESVILHILSFLNTKQAVRTCVLSSRWKHLWKRVPVVILHSSDFRNYKKFTRLVSKVLTLRDSSISLQALDFKRSNGRFEPNVKNIVDYAISHNVQKLGLCINGDIEQIPLTMFSSQILTHLKLSVFNGGGPKTLFPKSLNLPALTNLQLGNFAFGVDDNARAKPFSTFNRLNSLLICDCNVRGAESLCISSVTLVNLTVYNCNYNNFYEIDLCTPSLCNFAFSGYPNLQLSGSNVTSLKHVDIDAEVNSYREQSIMFLFSWLLVFANITSLTVSATTLQVLSFIPDLLKINFPSLGNLNYLRVEIEEILYRVRLTLCEFKLLKVKTKKEAARITKAFKNGLEPSSPIPDGVVDFLLQNSPSAKVDFIDCSKKRRKGGYM